MAIHHLALAPCGFFTNAPPAAVQFAASHMHLVHLKRREVLGDGKQPFNGLGVVLQGNLQAVDLTLDGREAALLTATLHETFGHANLLAAQRDAAWREVARRLAHEIRNPLTPIQLSAERLAMKLSPRLDEAGADFLTRSTEAFAIVQTGETRKYGNVILKKGVIPVASKR